jgi:alpha-1,6-mannosyltransferase
MMPAILTAIFVLACTVSLRLVAPTASGGNHIMSMAEVAPTIALLAIPTAVGLFAILSLARKEPTRRPIPIIFVVGLAMRLLWIGAPAPIEDDFQRYLWDGAMVANGFNPYRYSPQDLATHQDLPATLQTLRQSGHLVLPKINHPELTSIYPGTAQAAFTLAHWLAPFQIDGLRVVLLGAELATFALLLAWLGLLKRAPVLVALYWCNPLVTFTMIGQAHVDALLPPLVLGAFYELHREKARTASALLALAVGVKIWPLALVPLLARGFARSTQQIAQAALVFGALTGVALAPLILGTLNESSGLAEYAGNAHNNNAPYAWASYGVYLLAGESDVAQRLLRLAVAAIAILLVLWQSMGPIKTPAEHVTRVMIVTAMIFYASPTQFPWYAVWFLPWAVLAPSPPLLLATVTLPAYFTFFPLWNSGHGPTFLYGAALIHSVPVWAWLLWSASAQRLSTPSHPPREAYS